MSYHRNLIYMYISISNDHQVATVIRGHKYTMYWPTYEMFARTKSMFELLKWQRICFERKSPLEINCVRVKRSSGLADLWTPLIKKSKSETFINVIFV